MSKGLEALRKIEIHLDYLDETYNVNYGEEFDIIEKELKELEERREMMKRFNEACVPMILDNETEKKLKALEIINKKEINISVLKVCSTFKEYNNYIRNEYQYCTEIIEEMSLTQEEWDLLREVLL